VSSRIVLFGATGYTGRLVAEALARRKATPILAGRNREQLADLARELGGLEIKVADVSKPESVRGLVGAGEVLVSTVGPFNRFGGPAIEEAIAAGAHYVDSTGEPRFIRQVFEQYGPAAEKQGSALLTAFGYDFVPGNLAGALAIERAGAAATRVDIGYFVGGEGGGWSGGTVASGAGIVTEPGFTWRDGRLRTERQARRVRSFELADRRRKGFSLAGSEHFTLPRFAPQLREVNVYLGWFDRFSRAIQVGSAVGSVAFRVPGSRRLAAAAASLFARGSSGPDAEERARSVSEVVALAYDADGTELIGVHIVGVNVYTFTGEILAWGAVQAANTAVRGTGALGPVDAFGLEKLRSGCEEAGLSVSFS
jgi:short subunit dehydrogenase-like uncharacterized protein